MRFSSLLSLLPFFGLATAEIKYTGVNEAGLEFGLGTDGPNTGFPGVYGKMYTSPNLNTIPYWTDKGLNTYRLNFAWERLQPVANGAFDETYLGYIQAFVDAATGEAGGRSYVVLDPHNYARYYGKILGNPTDGEPLGTFATLWAMLADLYKDNDRVIFDLMNEPHDMNIDQWYACAQVAIGQIRRVGAQNLILVPGISWTGAHSWVSSGNAEAALRLSDPNDNMAFDMHQYFDVDHSGTHEECSHSAESVLSVATKWLKDNGKKGFLGEFAATDDASCKGVIEDALRYMEDNSDAWIGWNWWAAGPWWGSYMYSVEPAQGEDALLTPYLAPFFKGNEASGPKTTPTTSITLVPTATWNPPPRPTEPVGPYLTVVALELQAGWEDWSWNADIAQGEEGIEYDLHAYGAFSYVYTAGRFIGYTTITVEIRAPSDIKLNLRLDQTDIEYQSKEVPLKAEQCTGAINPDSFVQCTFDIWNIQFYNWDRFSLIYKSDKDIKATLRNVRVLPLTPEGSTPTTTTTARTTTTAGPTNTWNPPPRPTEPVGPYLTVVALDLQSGWEDWSWDATPQNTDEGIKYTLAAYGGIGYKYNNGRFIGYTTITADIKGTGPLALRLGQTDIEYESAEVPITSSQCTGALNANTFVSCTFDIWTIQFYNWDRFDFVYKSGSAGTVTVRNVRVLPLSPNNPNPTTTTTTTAGPTQTWNPPPRPTEPVGPYLTVVALELQPQWEDWSWDATPQNTNEGIKYSLSAYGGIGYKYSGRFIGYTTITADIKGSGPLSLRLAQTDIEYNSEEFPITSSQCTGSLNANSFVSCTFDIWTIPFYNWDRFDFVYKSGSAGTVTVRNVRVLPLSPGPVVTTTTNPGECVPTTVTERDTETITERETETDVRTTTVATTFFNTVTVTVTSTSGGQPTQGANCAALWGQCGGQTWTGATCCQSGSTCRRQNDYYYQCLQ